MIDFLEFPKTKKFDLIVEDVVFNSAVTLENANFVEEKISNVAKLSDMPKADALKQLEIGRQEISRIKLNELLEIRDFLNKQYPPNLVDFIKDLEWVKNKNQYISRSEIHFAVVYKCSESDDYITTFQLGNKEFKTKDGFKSPEDSKAWANEQYKEKLKEMLGL